MPSRKTWADAAAVDAAVAQLNAGTVTTPLGTTASWPPTVYAIALTGTGLSPQQIAQQAYLKASDAEAGDWFGCSVAASGDTVVVGALGEDSNHGAAYVFVCNGTTWTQQAYLHASNTLLFGRSVAVSGDTVVVGDNAERSAATGVNGNQADNSAPQAGAAYVFAAQTRSLRLTIVRDGNGAFSLRGLGIAGFSYRLLRTPSLAGPWDTIATQTAPPSGLVEFHDTVPLPGQAFYRVAQP